jgi:two-component system sensor histidine kinase ChvG
MLPEQKPQITKEKRKKKRPVEDSSIGLGFMFSSPLSIEPKKTRPKFIPSTLTVRILLINLLAPVLLVVGTLYIDEFQDDLIRSELRTLQLQSTFLAQTITNTSNKFINISEKGKTSLSKDNILKFLNKIDSLSNVHVRIYDPKGHSIIDNKNNKNWQRTNTYDEDSLSLPNVALYVYDEAIKSIIGAKTAEEYINAPYVDGSTYKEVLVAIKSGTESFAIRKHDEFGTIISVAAPIIHNGKIISAIMLATNTQSIKQGLTSLKIAIFRLFIVALIISIVLSLYLANTITRPIQKLAAAANTIRKGKGRASTIPDLSNRYDEIGDLSNALNSMTSALWNRLDMMEAFAADIAHELKNPITSLSSAVETLKRIKSPEKQEKLIKIIKHDTERMNRLITDISSLSRLDAELSRSKLQSVKLIDLMEDMLKNYNLQTIEINKPIAKGSAPKIEIKKRQGITIVKDFSGAVYGRVMGEETLLAQVFQNLLDNAISFSPPNGDIYIRVRGGKFVIVDIDDNGTGIPEGKEEKIFERFFSERPKTEEFGKHSGLGLSICKNIIYGLGGHLSARNRVDKNGKIIGARFSVFLKRAEE